MLNLCLLRLAWLFTVGVVRAGADQITFDYDGGNRGRIAYDYTVSQACVYDRGIMRADGESEIEPSGNGSFFVGLVDFVAAEGTTALQPMAEAAFQTGTTRTVAGYELGGNAGLAGNTYNVNL